MVVEAQAPPESVKSLITQLTGGDARARKRAADSLAALGPAAKAALPALRQRASTDPAMTVRIALLRAIAAIDEDRASAPQVLLAALDDKDWQVREAAAGSLAAAGLAGRAFEALWRRLAIEGDPDVRNAILRGFESGDAAVLASRTVESLQSADAREVRAAGRVARWLGDRGNLGETQRRGALEALWGAISRTSDAEVADELFAAVLGLGVPLKDALERLAFDPRIPQAVKSNVIDSNVFSDEEGLPALEAVLAAAEDKEPLLESVAGILELEDQWDQALVLDWLAGKTATASPGLQARINGLLEKLRDSSDLAVRNSASAWLSRSEQRQRAIQMRPLLETFRVGDEDARVEAIHKLLETNTREALRALIAEWVRWISYADLTPPGYRGSAPASLIQTAAERMRYSELAVIPLVEQLTRPASLEADLRRRVRIAAAAAIWSEQRNTPEDDTFRRLEDRRSNAAKSYYASLRTAETVTPEELREREDGLRQAEDEAELAFWESAFAREPALSTELEARVQLDLQARRLAVEREVARLLADMSDSRFFDDSDESQKRQDAIRGELRRHAMPAFTRRLPMEDDFEIQESLTHILGNLGGREAVEALARAVVGQERTRARRQELLARYYLEPSKERSQEAALILKGAVNEAKRTLWLLLGLNVIIFAAGVGLLVGGIAFALTNDDNSRRIAGALVGIGGFAGIIAQLLRDPLDRIQNAMANLVQIETAFTNFIWELNLNATYIQSQYVHEGILTDDEIANTVSRMELAMNLAMNLVALYTKEGTQRIVTRVTSISPASAEPGSTISIHGQHLLGDNAQKKERGGLIAVNHTPISAEDVAWNEHEVRLKLPGDLPAPQGGESTVWVSLFVDGLETNALPFNLVRRRVGNDRANGAAGR